jgi:hypothetical protein
MASLSWTRKVVFLALVLGTCGAGWAFAQELPPQICFLHLSLESNQVSLVSATVAPGKLKVFPAQDAVLGLEVATAAGQVLWTNRVADPSFRHLEYEDPDHPGQILSKEVRLTNTEFTVRIPVMRDAHHVNFYRLNSSSTTNGAGANPSTAQVTSPARQELGSVELPPLLR